MPPYFFKSFQIGIGLIGKGIFVLGSQSSYGTDLDMQIAKSRMDTFKTSYKKLFFTLFHLTFDEGTTLTLFSSSTDGIQSVFEKVTVLYVLLLLISLM